MAQANLISMAATARRQSARRGEAGLSDNAKTVVEIKKLPLVVFKLCTNGKINIFGNKAVCKKIIDENQQVALNIQKLLLDAHELGSDGAEFFSLLDNDGQPAIDSEDKGAITDCH